MERKKASGGAGSSFLKKLAIASVLTVAGLIIFSLTLFHLIPAHLYETWISQTLKSKTGLTIESASFATAFPFAFTFDGLKVLDPSGKEVLRMDSLRAGINPLGFLSGLRIDIEGKAGGGEVRGRAVTGLFGSSFELDASRVGFEALSALSSAGIKVDGAFDALLAVKMDNGCPKGTLKAQGVEFRGAQLSYRGFPLPMGSVDEAGVAAEFNNCNIRLDGLWIEGKDLSARLKGAVKIAAPFSSSPVDLTLELVPSDELLGKEYLLSLISSYKKSANYYSIPVKGTLAGLSAGM